LRRDEDDVLRRALDFKINDEVVEDHKKWRWQVEEEIKKISMSEKDGLS